MMSKFPVARADKGAEARHAGSSRRCCWAKPSNWVAALGRLRAWLAAARPEPA